MIEGADALRFGDPIDPEEGALAGEVLVVDVRDGGGRQEERQERARQQHRPRAQDQQPRRAERREREPAEEEIRKAPVATAVAGERRRQAADRQDEGGGGGEQMDAAQAEGRSGQESGDQGEGDGVLVDVEEDERRHQGDQEPADETAGRDREIEAGQVGRRRAQAGQRAVAVERGQGEDEKVDEADQEGGAAQRIDDRERDQRHRHRAHDERMGDRGAAREGVDEGAEIERERHDPEERHRRHVGREVARDREQERARDRGEREDAHERQLRRRLGRGFPLGCRLAAAGQPEPQDGEEGGQSEQDPAPGPRLAIQAEEGLEDERIGQEGRRRSRCSTPRRGSRDRPRRRRRSPWRATPGPGG